MPINVSDLPVNGGLIIGAALYGAIAFFGTGPEIAARMIATSNWSETCQRLVQAEVSRAAPAPAFRPKLDCRSTLGLLGRDGMAICRQHGNPSFNLPLMDQLFDYQDQLNARAHAQITAKADKAGTRCRCASAAMIESNRTNWALYAGSARLIAPPEVAGLQDALAHAFHSPICKPD